MAAREQAARALETAAIAAAERGPATAEGDVWYEFPLVLPCISALALEVRVDTQVHVVQHFCPFRNAPAAVHPRRDELLPGDVLLSVNDKTDLASIYQELRMADGPTHLWVKRRAPVADKYVQCHCSCGERRCNRKVVPGHRLCAACASRCVCPYCNDDERM